MSDSNNHRDVSTRCARDAAQSAANDRNPFTEDAAHQDVIAGLVATATRTHREPPESTRKHPRYPSEAERVKITLDLDPETITALRAIPEHLGAKKRLSAIAQAFLDYALEAYQSGHIELQPRLTVKGISFEIKEVVDIND